MERAAGSGQPQWVERVEDPLAALRCLASFAISMLQRETIEDLVWDIAENAGRLLGFEDCVLYLCEPHGLVQAAAYGVKSAGRHQIKNPIVIAYGEGIVGTVAVTGRGERIADLRFTPRYIQDEFAGRSELAVPITLDGRVLGVLDSECSRVDGYSPTDEALASAVASIAAPHIASARAHREQRVAVKALADAEESHRIQRIESLGVLASGIAHDFNNFLTAILGNVCLAKLNPTAPDVQEVLGEAEKACERAASLTHQLLTFSKGGIPVKETGDLGVLLTDSIQFALRGFNVAVELDVARDLGEVVMDRDQMAHVFHNLALNAAQAMGGAGRLRVKARRCDAAGSVEITIRDEGPGVPKQLHLQIFEPYFTTRESGSGLGLATALSIVSRHGGQLELCQDEEAGACFMVRLPPCRPEGIAATVTASPAAPGRILVLDDDNSARDTILRMLRSLGHDAVGVESGEECVALYKSALAGHHPFDALLMDLAIPGGMGGREAIKHIRALHADARAIVVSGYSDDPVLSDPESYGFRGRIRKPFRMHHIRKELDRVLEA